MRYRWPAEGIARTMAERDVAAYVSGDFKVKCVTFPYGIGETTVSGKDYENYVQRIVAFCTTAAGAGRR